MTNRYDIFIVSRLWQVESNRLTALKTISMRIRGAKTEMEEAGLETEGMAESTAKLQAEIKALSGVDIMLNKDTFKSTYQIMEELAAKWEDLTDIQQASITELIAGKRQGNIVASLMTNFDVAQESLQTSLDSEGSAVREHEKWMESLEAKLLQLKAAWQGLSQAFMKSDFLKGALDVIIKLVEGLTLLIDKAGTLPTLIAGFAAFKGIFGNNKGSLFGIDLKNTSKYFQNLNKELNRSSTAQKLYGQNAQAAGIYTSSLGGKIKATAKDGKAISKSMTSAAGSFLKTKAASMAATVGMSLLQGAIIAVASIAISAAIKKFDEWIETSDELSERIDELTAKYKDQHETLTKSKSDFDVDNAESLVSQYAKLSKGVGDLGENISLTSGEYENYISITNEIASLVPSLVAGYDAQGNAILNTKGNVEDLIEAYHKLIEVQNNKILAKTGDIQEDFKNVLEDSEKTDAWGKELTTKTVNAMEHLLNKTANKKEIEDYITKNFQTTVDNSDRGSISGGETPKKQILEALEVAGVEVKGKTASEALAKAIKNEPEKVRAIIDDYQANLEAELEGMKSIAQATISNAFDIGKTDYSGISDKLQGIARSIVSSFDLDFYTDIIENGGNIQDEINSLLDSFNDLQSSGDGAKIEAIFDMQTRFNNGDISYGEFVNAANEAYGIIDNLNVSDDIKNQFKLSLNTEGVEKDYVALTKRLTSKKNNLGFTFDTDEAKDFLNNLTRDELAVAADIIPELEEEGTVKCIDDLKSAIDREMALRGLTIDLDVTAESEGLELLNTALAESVSATGLSAESVSALKSRYADLEAKGYDLSAMFEETSNGIHLNRSAFSEMEQAYASQKLDDVNKDLASMEKEYNNLTEDINNCTDATKRAELVNKQQSLARQINEAATLASQYEGLASAYNAWINAEEAGQERDMYENIISGFENVEDEISRGWVDDGTIKFLELLTGETNLASKSGKELKEVYEGLDDTIKNTSYSVSDFFTVDDEGNSTNAGVYNFLDAVHQLEKTDAFKNIEGIENLVKKDKNGNIVSFDFGLVGGDEAIAEALGVSEELVQIMVRAADDAGFVVNIDGAYTQLADLQSQAITANNELKELSKTNKELKEVGGDHTFDFNTTNVETIKDDLKVANNILDSFKDKDGNIDLKADGAKQAMTIVSTLQAKLDNLNSEKYGIGLTVEDEKFQEPLEKLQEYGHNIATLHQLEINPNVNTEEIENINAQLNETAKYFAGLDKDTKVELGFKADDGIKEVKEKIESGKVKIPTVLDVQTKMGQDIEDLKKIALLNSGLLSEEQEEAIKLDLVADVTVEAGEVNTDNLEKETEEKAEEAVHEGGEKGSKKGRKNRQQKPSSSEKDTDKKIAKTRKELKKLREEADKATAAVIANGSDTNSDAAVENIKKNREAIEAYKNAYNEHLSSIKNLGEDNRELIVDVAFDYERGDKSLSELNSQLDNLKNEKVEADVVVELAKSGTFDEVFTMLKGKNKKIVIEALTEGTGDVGELNKAIDSLPKEEQTEVRALIDNALVNVGIVDGKLQELDGETIDTTITGDSSDAIAAANEAEGAITGVTPTWATAFLGDSSSTVVAAATAQTAIDGIDGTKETTIKATIAESFWEKIRKAKEALAGIVGVNGTANINGTAFANGTIGTAFKKGDWSTKDSGTALGGELGQETIVRDGRFFTIGDRGAEFFQYKKGDIIFNHKQTEELFKNGKVTSGGGRGRALVSGTAFAEGLAFSGGKGGSDKVEIKTDNVTINSKNTGSSGKGGGVGKVSGKSAMDSAKGKTSSTSSSSKTTKDTTDDFEETFDWIEIAISRLERAIDRLDQKASRTWKSWSSRNTNLRSEIKNINTEITTLDKAYDKYIAKANSVGLDNKWKKKVRQSVKDGYTIDFSTIKDEDLAEKIKEYQTYYEKALDCEDKLLDAQDNRMSKYMELFDNVMTKYDGILQRFDHKDGMLNEYISQQEEKGHIVSKKYYQGLKTNKNNEISWLKGEYNALIKARDEWVAAGGDTNSEDYRQMCADIDAVTLSIEQARTAKLEYDKAMRQIDWDVFDLTQERISNLIEEADFFVDLMSSKDLYDDNGQLTDEGMATMGLHAQNYDAHMEEAANYDAEIADLNSQIEKDPYDQDLIKRRDELLKRQRDSIKAAQDEKEAIRDMVEEGIEIELDALQEKIDKHNEALDSAKDLYEYNKKVKEQTKEIADLEKQMAAYAGDDSEEAKAKAQEIQVALNEAKENLKETEYEKYISDQQALLDDLYTQYEEVLNTRLDNVDQLLSDMITEVNDSSSQIAQTIKAVADAAGYDISEAMDTIWNNEDNDKDVVSTYTNGSADSDTTTSEAVNDIEVAINDAVAASDVEATNNIPNANSSVLIEPKKTTTTSKKTATTKKTTATTNNKTIKKDGKIKAAGAKIYDYKGDKSGETQYYKKDPVYKVLAIDGNWIKARYHKLKSGVSGWFKKGDVKAYKTGAKSIKETMAAWTQEGGREFIVRPSDGAILTPLAEGDSVLNANASGNIWDMANNPAEFIKNNLDLGIGSVPNVINMQNSYTQNLENVVFNMPNVQNYNELLSAMQKDKNFEKLILSMSIDRVAGKSSLAKGKAIR